MQDLKQKMKNNNNAKLILQLQKGNEKAWREVVELYSNRLFSYAVSLCSDKSKASDIVQQVFVSLYEYRFKLNHKYSLEHFLYKSVYNQFINYYKKEKSLSRIHEQYYYILNQIIDENLDVREDRIKMLNTYIELLPKKTKLIFILKKKRGLTNKEVSEKLSISIKSVEFHMTKAFKFLRKNLIEAHKVK